jgi:hypothetical protein
LAVGSKRRRAAAIRWRAWAREEAKFGYTAGAQPPTPLDNEVPEDRAKPMIDDDRATPVGNQLDSAALVSSLST